MSFLLVRFLSLAVLLGAAAPPPDPVRDRIIADAAAQTPASLAFDRTSHVVQVGGGTRTELKRVERWDGRTWSLVSVNGKPPKPAEAKTIAKTLTTQPVPGYHRLAALVAASTASRTDADGRLVLTIPQLPPKSVISDGTDISRFLKAEAVIATSKGQPWVQELRMSSREPFKMSWVLKVLTLDEIYEYKLDTAGRPRLASQSADSKGTMFGFPGGETREVTYAYR